MFEPSSFKPAWWLPGRHLQTTGARYLRALIDVPLRRERVELPDGDFVDLDFAFPSPNGDKPEGPLALVLHGLEGSAQSGYALELYRRMGAVGIHGVGINFRSCSGELNRLPRLYHSGETEDLRYVHRWLENEYPGRRLALVGVSLGGNVLLKYLGECAESARSTVAAAVAISVPFDLSAGADFVARPLNRIYGSYLLRKLRAKLEAKRHCMPPSVDVERALAATSFRAFDDAATAPLHGFAGAEDYYRRSSSAAFLGRIRVPTLLVHSADDPFLPPECIPRRTVRDNPSLVAAFTDNGGHVGFVAGRSPFRAVYWAEREAVRFIGHRLEAETRS